jgi:SNF2 family DNA or RNA helicase
MTSDDYLVINKNFEKKIVNEVVLQAPDENELNEVFDKYKNLEILLKKRKVGSKFLIFSSSDISFYKVIPILHQLNIRYDFLKGNQYVINNMLNNYNNSNLDVLLVNATYYGAGLNIEKTSDIILFHRFDTQMEQQIIGRAHRLGREEELSVHYLLYENEYSTQTSRIQS